MIPDRRLVTLSKYLSRHLRHDPHRLGLTLEPGGWVRVADLLAAAAADGHPITPAELAEVVARSEKQRFALRDEGGWIRANQGHSVAIDLQLSPQTPPDRLFHGTSHAALPAILEQGLQKMSRHHVHLSPDPTTARQVGMRQGSPVVLAVAAGAMAAEGWTFFCSANGVWLVDQVPPQYLQVLGQ